MIDLCIDVRMAFHSGIGTYIRELVPQLKDHFRLILLVDRLDSEWCKEFEQILFHVPIYSLVEQMQIQRKIPKCDLFWSPHYNVPLFKIRAKKRIVTIHDVCHLVFGSRIEKLYAKIVMGKAVKSDQIITVSQFSKGEIEKRFGKKNIEAVHIGVNFEKFHRKEPSEEIRKKYRLPQNYTLFIGSSKAHKNLEGLLRSGLTDLVVIGPGIREVDAADLPYIYSMADVLVFPSFYEGFGLPPLEAMCCGLPTAVSNVASIPEVCGDASLYFDPHDVDAIRETVLAAKNRKDLIEKGLRRAKQFSWEKTAEKHIEIFKKVHFA